MAEKVKETRESYEKLVEELEYLRHVARPKNIAALQEARAQGDLSENADYDAAREEQARIESRIKELEHSMKNIEIVDVEQGKKGVVSFGSIVEIMSLDDNEIEKYKIVGPAESDPFSGKLSNETPLARAILDKKEGATVMVKGEGMAHSYQVKILSVSKEGSVNNA